jgi:hypothetical protein
MTCWTPAKKIIELYKTKSEEYFYNFVLGLPYIGAGNKLQLSDILGNLTSWVNDQKRVVIGVDQGNKKHFVCGNDQGLFYYGVTESWKEIERLLNRFENSIMVIDALPDLTPPRELKEKYPGRVFLCHFARDRKTYQIVRWGKNEEDGSVLVDRNRAIQMVVDDFITRKIPLQGTRDDWNDYWTHWKTMFRLVEEDQKLGTPIYEWKSGDGNDHLALATTYWRVGMDKYGFGESEIVGAPIRIDAPIGPQISVDNTIPSINQEGKDIVETTMEQLKGDIDDDWRNR